MVHPFAEGYYLQDQYNSLNHVTNKGYYMEEMEEFAEREHFNPGSTLI